MSRQSNNQKTIWTIIVQAVFWKLSGDSRVKYIKLTKIILIGIYQNKTDHVSRPVLSSKILTKHRIH